MNIKLKAVLTVPLLIGFFVCVIGLLGYLTGRILMIPVRLGMPSAVRFFGIAVLLSGFLFMGWLFKYRRPGEILVSTYVTIRKAVMRIQPEAISKRTESLILTGPQMHVRHPLYFAVVLLLLGWWLTLDYTFILLMAIAFFLWYNLVVIPFEEKELKALYPKEYEKYIKAVPRFFPSIKPRWP